MNIFSKLREVAARRVKPLGEAVEPPVRPVSDSNDMLVSDADEVEPVLDGIRLEIDYVDAAGQRTSRLITCKRLFDGEDGERLMAYCHLRRIDRSFLLSRISKVREHATGREIASLQGFLEPFLEGTDGASAVQLNATRNLLVATGDELRILAFIAYADAELQEAEDGLISLYLRRRAEELGHDVSANYDHMRVMEWFRHQAPDIAVLERSVQRVARRSEVNLQRIWKVAARVMEADGEVTVEELERLHELSSTVDAAVAALRNENK